MKAECKDFFGPMRKSYANGGALYLERRVGWDDGEERVLFIGRVTQGRIRCHLSTARKG